MSASDLLAALDPERLLAFTQELIRTPSLSTEEAAISRLISDEMRRLGYDQVRVDELNNVVGVIRGSAPGPRVLFNGHIDHAGVGDMPEPFSAQLLDGEAFGHPGQVVYGRGACDMKAAVAAMVQAAGAAKRAGLPRAGEVIVTCVAREEMARGEGVRHLLKNGLRADFAVSGEASGLKVYLGHRGKFECRVTSHGRTTHGANPAGGINAIYEMNNFLSALQTDYPLPEHQFLGRATVTVLDIMASPGALTPIVPDRCGAIVDRRFLPDEDEATLLGGFRELFSRIQGKHPQFKAEVESLKWFPAMYTPPEEPIVRAMFQARERVLGAAGSPGAWYFGVDGTFLNQAGIPTVGLGPGNEYLAHTPNDVTPVREIQDAARIYLTLIQQLCG